MQFSSHSPPSVDDVRRAVRHMIGLAIAFEDSEPMDQHSLETFRGVVQQLSEDLDNQRVELARQFVLELQKDVAEAIRPFTKDACGAEVEEAVEEVFQRHGIQLDESDLDLIEIDPEDRQVLGGPKMWAAQIVGGVFHRVENTLVNWEKREGPIPVPENMGVLTPSAFRFFLNLFDEYSTSAVRALSLEIDWPQLFDEWRLGLKSVPTPSKRAKERIQEFIDEGGKKGKR